MKKLMVAIAAVATAFGLYADEPVNPDPGCTSYTDFNSFTQGALKETTGTDTTATWTVPEGDKSTIEAIDHAMTDVPKVFGLLTSAGNSLKVETTLGNPVYRDIASPLVGTDGNAYADFQASFTVFDSDPEFTAYSDAKVALWLQEELDGDDVKGTNLWLRAGVVGGDPKSYNCGSVEKYDLKDWNRVTVKVIGNISSGAAVPGIVVFINKKVATVAESYDIGTVALNPKAKVWFDQGALFPSLQATAGVKGLGFDGKGYIDNVAYTRTTPFDGAADSDYFTITWNTDKVASLTVAKSDNYDVDTSVAGQATIVFKQGVAVGSVAYSWVGKGNWMDGNDTATPSGSGSTVPVATNITEAEAKVDNKKFETIDAAVAAATEGETVILLANVTAKADLTFVDGVKLDLAGKTLTLPTETGIKGGAIVLANSVTDGYAIIDGACSEVTGTFAAENYNIKFAYVANYNPRTSGCAIQLTVPTGKKWAADGTDYWFLDTATYTVTVQLGEGITAVATNKTQGGAAVSFDATDDFTVKFGDSIEVDYACSVPGYEPSADNQGLTNIQDNMTLPEVTKDAIDYNITYKFEGLAEGDKSKVVNPNAGTTTYTIESETITFAAATCEGYTFKGFAPASINKGSTGDKEIVGTFEKAGAPLPEPIKAGNAEQKAAYAKWASDNGITDDAAINAVGFALDVSVTMSIDEVVQDALDDVLETEPEAAAEVAKFSADYTPAYFYIEEYPNAKFIFVETKEIESENGKFFRLKAEFNPLPEPNVE